MSEQAAWRVVARGIVLAFALWLAVVLATALQPVLLQVLMAILLAAGATPVVDALTRAEHPRWLRWRPSRGLAALSVFLLTLVAIIGLALLVVGVVATDMSALAAAAPGYLNRLRAGLDDLLTQRPDLALRLQGLLPTVETLVSASVGVVSQVPRLVGIATQVFGGVLDVLLTAVIALYLTIDGDRVRRYAIRFLPFDRHEQALRVTENMGTRLGAWARGEALLMAVIGSLTWAAATAIGVPYAGVLALIAGVGELIPTIGPIVAAVPFIAVGLISSPTQGLLALVAAVLVQQLENNLIVPRIMSQALNLHPVVVIVAILAGGQLLGIVGALLAVPVTAAISVVVDEIQRERLAHYRRAESGRTESAPPAPPAAR